jgi:thiamine pyrophosphate-dependent acetolactate synthase large subunit-like protein
VGVCTVTQGPGVTNALSALNEANKAGSPLLFLCGETPASMPGHHQYVDQAALFNALGAGVQRLRAAATVAEDIARAYNRARIEGRPIAVSVPNDWLLQPCPESSLERVALTELPPPTRPEERTLQALVRLIESCERPLILAGRGAVRSGARGALEALGERIGALYATTVHSKGFFHGQRFDAGVTGGFASEAACRLIGQADLVLAFGASLPIFATRNREIFAPAVKIVQVDTRPAALGAATRIDYGVVGDVAATAAALLPALERERITKAGFRSSALQKDVDALHAPLAHPDQSDGKTADPLALMTRLDALLPAERTVVVDSGHAMCWSVQHLSVPDGQGFIFGNDFMVVGLGVAMAIGAAVARPERLTVAAPGDGGLCMSIGELETLVRYKIPMLVLAINDAGFGVEVHILRHASQPTTHASFTDTDFAAVGRAFGTEGITVRKPGDLDALKPWLSSPRGPMVVDCKVNPSIMADWFKENLSPASWLVRMMSH